MKKTSKITPELLDKCENNDRRSIKDLYEESFRIFLPVCLRYHRNEEDARSVFNNAFLNILNNLNKLNDRHYYYVWAKRIIVNALIDEYRKKQLNSDFINYKETESELEVLGTYSELNVEGEIDHQLILKLVAELPETLSKIFNLHVVEGYSHKEIAEMFGIAEGTSKWHLAKARKILIEQLEQIETKRGTEINTTY